MDYITLADFNIVIELIKKYTYHQSEHNIHLYDGPSINFMHKYLIPVTVTFTNDIGTFYCTVGNTSSFVNDLNKYLSNI